MASIPHASFLQAMQDWVWKRFPTRQLSATDIFYALQWADSSVPSCYFIDGFEGWIAAHPGKFENDGRLSMLQFEASHVITQYRKQTASETTARPLVADDPYAKALNRIAEIGRRAENPLLRETLRQFYSEMRENRKIAEDMYPMWNQRAESYYPFKARAILDWEKGVHSVVSHCFSFLADSEQDALKKLSHVEKLHCMQISEEAQNEYMEQRLNKKIAEYFDITELLDSL